MTYVAFLRGINVGGRIVKMADLKTCFESLGCGQVTTYLQTGNVVFESTVTDKAKLESVLELGISTTFNYQARVFVRSLPDIADAIKRYPFKKAEDNNLHDYLVLLKDDDLAIELATEAYDPAVESLEAGRGLVYWRIEKGMTLKSTFSKQLTKAKYKELHTTRNLKTLQKIVS